MPAENEGPGTDLGHFAEELGRLRPTLDPPDLSHHTLDDVAVHDFAFYDFLLPVGQGYETPAEAAGDAAAGLTDESLLYLRPLEENGASEAQLAQVTGLLLIIERAAWRAIRDLVYWDRRRAVLHTLLDTIYFRHRDHGLRDAALPQLLSAYAELTSRGGNAATLEDLLYRALLRKIEDWRPFFPYNEPFPLLNFLIEFDHLAKAALASLEPDPVAPDHPFEIFPPRSINLGLRIVYRQHWRPLGRQKGEVVRTVPLGPGQRERVVTKIVRRRKQVSTLETVTAAETTTETTDSTKDSSEVVREASDTFRWNQDLTVEGKFFGIGARSQTTLGGNQEEKSRRTSSHLSESMQKTASKMRRETKVVVSTEAEETVEHESSSEIVNPNNEIAITYEYHRMQHQYEVWTYLGEVQSVLFVAEHVPTPGEIDDAWIRRHDWILAKALLDESLRAVLNELIQDVEEDDALGVAPGAADNPFRGMLQTATGKFAQFNEAAAANQALTLPDIYAEPLRAFRQHLQDSTARDRANRLRGIRRGRLRRHLRDHVLHYCRAIWAHEDADQRMLRYKKENRRVPLAWLPDFQGGWAPAGTDAPLWELIDPTGPLGFVGNYAVFAVHALPEGPRREPALEVEVPGGHVDPFPFPPLRLEHVFAILRGPYVGPDRRLRDPALDAFRHEAQEVAAQNPALLAAPPQDLVIDVLSYLPALGKPLARPDGLVAYAPDRLARGALSVEEYALYLYRRNGTRRFLVDSNNLYLRIDAGEGAALEPFKRAHRYIDVLKAWADLRTAEAKNERRQALLDEPAAYDPDIAKVIVVGAGAGSAGDHAAWHDAVGDEPSPPAGGGDDDGDDG